MADTPEKEKRAQRPADEPIADEEKQRRREGYEKRTEHVAQQFDRDAKVAEERKKRVIKPAEQAEGKKVPLSSDREKNIKDPIPREARRIRLPKGFLNLLIIKDGKGENQQPSMAIEATINGKSRILEVVDDAGLVKDTKTGRMLIRFWRTDPDTGLRTGTIDRYDPLSRRILSDKDEQIDQNVKNADRLAATPAVEYAKEFAEVVADNIDEDIHRIDIEVASTQPLTRLAGLDKTFEKDKARGFLVSEIEYDDQGREIIHLAFADDPFGEQVGTHKDSLRYMIVDGKVFPDELSVGGSGESFRDEVNNADANATDPSVRDFIDRARRVAERATSQTGMPLAEQIEELQSIRSDLQGVLNDRNRSQGQPVIDAISARLIELRQEMDEQEAQAQGAAGPEEPSEAPPGSETEGSTIEDNEWRRRFRNRFREEAYYEQQSGTVPTPDAVGFALAPRFVADEDIPSNQLTEQFSQRIARLTTNNPDQQERVANERMIVDWQNQFTNHPDWLLYVPQSSVDLQTRRPDQSPNPNYGRIIGPIELRRRTAQGTVRVEPPVLFDPSSEEDRKNILLIQYAELQVKQERWLTEELQKAFNAFSDEELQISLRNIRSSESNFVSDSLREKARAIITLNDSKRTFKQSGPEGFGRLAKDFSERATYLMNLPGVAEVLAEIEQREFEAQNLITENGVTRRLNPANGRDNEIIQRRKRERKEREIAYNSDPRFAPENRTFDDNPEEPVGMQHLNAVSNPDDSSTADQYRKIRKSILRAAAIEYDQWKTAEIARKTADRDQVAGTNPAKELALTDEINRLQNSHVDQTSVEVAEAIWRMTGRSAFFGAQSSQGENNFYEMLNYPRWAIEKQKSNGNNAILGVAFGTADIPTAQQFLPGLAANGKTDFLHTGFYDYFTNYDIVEPGQQLKQGLATKGLHKEMTPHENEVMRRIYRRYLGFEPDNPSRLSPEQRAAILKGSQAGTLSDEEKRVLAKWHWLPIMKIDLASWRAMSKDGSIWGDWNDFGDDFRKARANNDTLNEFLTGPDLTKVKEMQTKY